MGVVNPSPVHFRGEGVYEWLMIVVWVVRGRVEGEVKGVGEVMVNGLFTLNWWFRPSDSGWFVGL